MNIIIIIVFFNSTFTTFFSILSPFYIFNVFHISLNVIHLWKNGPWHPVQ